MTTDITEMAQREKFEVWAHSQKLSLAYGDCGYAFSSTEMAWRAWMASSAELVEALEKAQQQNKSDFEIKARLCKESNSLHDRLREAEKRIAELESRTVTIEPFRSFVTDADLAALHRFVECCDDPESGGHDLEKEQVRRLESIGALQRSGRISYITGFGDFLISITAGIKWEAE
ncbi:hypothetical protein [Klebsiella aerogenes]|uniref:hypothetical protein n=1 Tax=Klebsiella aerogenes TaxID=548 RepID=UPI0020A6C9A8|nr:hypothetical protein [Klebsiella aerogenes]